MLLLSCIDFSLKINYDLWLHLWLLVYAYVYLTRCSEIVSRSFKIISDQAYFHNKQMFILNSRNITVTLQIRYLRNIYKFHKYVKKIPIITLSSLWFIEESIQNENQKKGNHNLVQYTDNNAQSLAQLGNIIGNWEKAMNSLFTRGNSSSEVIFRVCIDNNHEKKVL